jgi:hypothetical protein
LQAAATRDVDALAAVYHSDHRELCAHVRDWPFAIINVLEVVAASMGLAQQDHYKRLKMLQDADAILLECRDLLAQHGIDEAAAREVIASMLADQPLALAGKTDHARRGRHAPRVGRARPWSPPAWWEPRLARPAHPPQRASAAGSWRMLRRRNRG